MSVPVGNYPISLIGLGKSEEIWQIFDASLTKFVTKKLRKFAFSDLFWQMGLPTPLARQARPS